METHSLNRPSPDLPSGDQRLYVPNADSWTTKVKRGWKKEYCFSKAPGEDFFHRLMGGEIYLEQNNERYCLTCALRYGIITTDRLYWQHPPKKPTLPSQGNPL